MPLIPYHAGGEAASFWPPSQHLADYNIALAMHFGFGIAACYRGPALYDDPLSQALVARWTAFFQQHRDILTSDVIHIQRADGQRIDGFLHANPTTPERALAMFFNPTDTALSATMPLPLYYAGVAAGDQVHVAHESQAPVLLTANARSRVMVNMTIPPNNVTWFLVQ